MVVEVKSENQGVQQGCAPSEAPGEHPASSLPAPGVTGSCPAGSHVLFCAPSAVSGLLPPLRLLSPLLSLKKDCGKFHYGFSFFFRIFWHAGP